MDSRKDLEIQLKSFSPPVLLLLGAEYWANLADNFANQKRMRVESSNPTWTANNFGLDKHHDRHLKHDQPAVAPDFEQSCSASWTLRSVDSSAIDQVELAA